MNLKLLILCINAVAATTSHNHHLLRQKPEHHDIAFRATKSDLRRLLKGEEEAPNQDLEALHVLRGSGRVLKDLECFDENGVLTDTCDGDDDTHTCTKDNQCKEVCDDDDCNGNGECKKGKCDCDEGFEGKDCSKQAVEYYIVVGTEVTDEERSIECLAALKSLEKDIEKVLPTTVTAESNRSKRTRNRHLKKSSSGDGALKIVLSFNAGPNCSRDKLLNQVWGQVNGEGSEHTDEDDRTVVLPSLSDADLTALNCLVEESEDILKGTKKEDGLEDDLNELIPTCAVTDTDDIACIVECNDEIEDDCEKELKEEDDCEGVHDELEKCYEKCYGL